jgi:copper(I)-binding protein
MTGSLKDPKVQSMPSLIGRKGTLIVFLGSILLLGCGEEGEGDRPQVLEPWARSAVAVVEEESGLPAGTTAAYMRIRNPGSTPDLLLGAETSVARAVEIHRTTMEGDLMRMREVGPVEIPGGEEVAFEPGGLHLMLKGLRRSLSPGDSVSLTLAFRNGGEVEVRLPVRAAGGV